MSYTFGDDEPAVERLRLVASAYDAISRAFLAAHVPLSTDVAIHLGCGPGFSTQLLYEVCAPHTLIGIDSSSQFVELAGGGYGVPCSGCTTSPRLRFQALLPG